MFTNDKKRPIMSINTLSHKVYFMRQFSYCSNISQLLLANLTQKAIKKESDETWGKTSLPLPVEIPSFDFFSIERNRSLCSFSFVYP